MKVFFKKSVFFILLFFGIVMLLADGETCDAIIFSKVLFFADAIFIGYLWKWWHMDDYYKNLEED